VWSNGRWESDANFALSSEEKAGGGCGAVVLEGHAGKQEGFMGR